MRTITIEGAIELEVLVHGRPVQEYPYQGMIFVEGRRKSEYTLRVRNNTSRRLVAVVSVDGLSVMTGQNASVSDSGYVVEAYDYVDIPGWRLNQREVAHFFFGSLPEAYAAQMGKPTNIGVIGAAIFFEKRFDVPVWNEGNMKSLSMRGGPESYGGEATRSIGTGFGRLTEHKVQSVRFDREDHTAAVMEIRYDDDEGLFRKYGIRVTSAHNAGDSIIDANPFPGDTGATPPPGWRR